MNTAAPTALIAEDEPLLALALQSELACAWPASRSARRCCKRDTQAAIRAGATGLTR
jgi:hypothetical protein